MLRRMAAELPKKFLLLFHRFQWSGSPAEPCMAHEFQNGLASNPPLKGPNGADSVFAKPKDSALIWMN